MDRNIVCLVLYSNGQEIKLLIHLDEQSPEIKDWIKTQESENGQEG